MADGRTLPIQGTGYLPAPCRPVAFAFAALNGLRKAKSSAKDPVLIFSTHVNLAPISRMARKVAHVRFLVVGHGIEVWNICKTSVQRALRSADQLLAVSDFTRTCMAGALKVDPKTIELLPNTFDPERFEPGPKSSELLKRYNLTNDQPVILTVARLETTEQYKGYDNVLLAMPEVLERFPTARYVIVGDGADRARVEALIRRLHLSVAVIMTGYVPNDSLRDHYNLCDLFAMPSKGEGFGIVFLEALACGRPVIAGNKDASSEALLDGKLGTLVDPDDEDDIGQAICATLTRLEGQKSETTQQEGEERRRAVVAAFGYERFRERMAEILCRTAP
jgi:glycosyltransferase involved in cell wall biosynthesis